MFTRGSAQSPNWLPEWWVSVTLDSEKAKSFSTNVSCINGDVSMCCKELGYSSSSPSVWQKTVQETRFAAEFLGSKKIIESKSFSPGEYALQNNITRKEIMKIVMNASGKEIQTECREIFKDVPNDWSCKYIESALEYDFIVGNQRFRPDENVTQVEALKLIFQARNIDKRYSTDYWQEDYISSAYYLGYIDEKFKSYNIFATRGFIFQTLARTYNEYTY